MLGWAQSCSSVTLLLLCHSVVCVRACVRVSLRGTGTAQRSSRGLSDASFHSANAATKRFYRKSVFFTGSQGTCGTAAQDCVQ